MVLLVVAMLLCARLSVAQVPPPLPASAVVEASVRLTITPGKPGAPTEIVHLTKQAEKYTLAARRLDTYQKPMAQQEGEITAHDFATVWQIIEREALRAFLPQERQERAMDFGRREVHIAWQLDKITPPQHHTFAWANPLASEAQVRPLVRSLGQLVQRALPGMALFYIVPR